MTGRISVTKRFSFDSAHKLPHYNGKCKNLHGHTYHCELTFSNFKGEPICDKNNPSDGMIIDFSVIKQHIISPLMNDLDHTNINKLIKNPTAELIVLYIVKRIKSILEPVTYFRLTKVRLWETPDSYATWEEGNENK